MQDAQRESHTDALRPIARYTLPKGERLTGMKGIEALFHEGNSRSAAAFPLRVVYMLTDAQPADVPVRILISVPKKRFKHAVDRNRVKRQVREAYRRHKLLLLANVPAGKQLLMAFIWLSDSHFHTPDVEQRVVNLLRRVAEKIKGKSES